MNDEYIVYTYKQFGQKQADECERLKNLEDVKNYLRLSFEDGAVSVRIEIA